ncbi:hypothetical protein BV25DRAFT_1921804 [Artomyces pyxidatus]|uniref:Uncharacterized protein n=1 Tax=Artomyces pyxidatus TaxID=48021 RepID=A0ACB8SHN8_9AGAM|nr:hypothetical protein BV25DRAFT_1921804 [Artomyces pyxidatus]
MQVAAWMEATDGERRGLYIWGRSALNVRIERLWVVTAQPAPCLTAPPSLLAHINRQLTFFAESWNHRRIQIRGGPNRSPNDMFRFDMLGDSIRGDRLLLEDNMPDTELEVFVVDWDENW